MSDYNDYGNRNQFRNRDRDYDTERERWRSQYRDMESGWEGDDRSYNRGRGFRGEGDWGASRGYTYGNRGEYERGGYGQQGWRGGSERSQRDWDYEPDYGMGQSDYGYNQQMGGRGYGRGQFGGQGSQQGYNQGYSGENYGQQGYGRGQYGGQGSQQGYNQGYSGENYGQQGGYNQQQFRRGQRSGYGGEQNMGGYGDEWQYRPGGAFGTREDYGSQQYRQGGGYGQSQMGGRDQWMQEGPHRGRGPRGFQRSTERLREDINERLMGHGWIDASDIDVRVANGEVTLEGFVSSREEKRMAEDIAESVMGVNNVQNNIRVRRENDEQNMGTSSQNRTSGSTSGGSSSGGSTSGSTSNRSGTTSGTSSRNRQTTS